MWSTYVEVEFSWKFLLIVVVCYRLTGPRGAITVTVVEYCRDGNGTCFGGQPIMLSSDAFNTVASAYGYENSWNILTRSGTALLLNKCLVLLPPQSVGSFKVEAASFGLPFRYKMQQQF